MQYRLLPKPLCIGMVRFLLWAVEEPRPGLLAERLPGAMKMLVDFANATDGINELHIYALQFALGVQLPPYF